MEKRLRRKEAELPRLLLVTPFIGGHTKKAALVEKNTIIVYL
jgi:hypothetical protein